MKQKKETKLSKPMKKAITKLIKQVDPVEMKQYTLADASVSPISNNLGTTYLLNAPGAVALQQGTAQNQRIGVTIYVHEARWRATCRLSAAGQDDSLRLIMVNDKQAGGALFPTTDLFTNVGAGRTIHSPFNVDTVSERYQILEDRTYNFHNNYTPALVTVADKDITIVHKFKRPLKVTYFPGAIVGVAAIEFNALQVFCINSNFSAAVALPVSSLLYTDA